MSIIGAKRWDSNPYFDCYWPNLAGQKRVVPNPLEDITIDMSGPQAAVTAIAAIGFNVLLKPLGNFIPRPEGLYVSWFQKPEHAEYFDHYYKVIDKIIMDDWYSFFASEFFSCFTTELDKLSVNEVLRNLRHNRALQVRYKGTEHDIALVAYDTQTNEFILKEADQFSPVPEDKLVELFEPKAFAYGAIRPEEFRRY